MERTIVHLITGLGKGGTETMLYQVLKYRQNREFDYKVISLGGAHYYEEPIRELGYDVVDLDVRKRPLSSFLRVCRETRGADTLCCWMYHANFVGYLAGRLCHVKRLVWNIRQSDLTLGITKAPTRRISQICARWSKNVSAILYNGNRARAEHEGVGYCREKGSVLDNGCNCEDYHPDETAAEKVRSEFGIPDRKKIILSVTKNAPGKDLPTFLAAYGKLRERQSDVVSLLCGLDVTPDDKALAVRCKQTELSVGEDIFLLGMRHDVPRLLAACDLYVLHSSAEAFPNALLQAMACGCECVTTDVGDARRILGNDDCVVPPGDPEALAKKMAELMSLPEDKAETMRCENRVRVQEHFDIREIVKTYERLF